MINNRTTVSDNRQKMLYIYFLIICKCSIDRKGIIFITRHTSKLYNINGIEAL